MCRYQELLPSLGKEERPEKDKQASTAAVKAWLVGLTRKRKDGISEEPPASSAEPVLMVAILAFSKKGSYTLFHLLHRDHVFAHEKRILQHRRLTSIGSVAGEDNWKRFSCCQSQH